MVPIVFAASLLALSALNAAWLYIRGSRIPRTDAAVSLACMFACLGVAVLALSIPDAINGAVAAILTATALIFGYTVGISLDSLPEPDKAT